MQGLVATNPEDISKMDVVGIVPSVPFEPGTDLYGRMLSESSGGRWAFYVKRSKKVTLSLKPHQLRMTENQGICSKVRWVMPKQDKIFPLSRCPFLYISA